jgi:hypothetical protein
MKYHTELDLFTLTIERKKHAACAKILRDSERKWFKRGRRAEEAQKVEQADIFNGTGSYLQDRRKQTLRAEARIDNLVHAFLRNVPYEVVEQKAWARNYWAGRPTLFWKKVALRAQRFAHEYHNADYFLSEVQKWRNQHPAYAAFKLYSDRVAAGEQTTIAERNALVDLYGDAWFDLVTEELNVTSQDTTSKAA